MVVWPTSTPNPLWSWHQQVSTLPAFLSGPAYLSLPRDPQPWVIRDLIPVEGLTNIFGKPKAGKSFAALGMAHAISNDGIPEWLGFAVQKHGPVAYLQIDTPRGEWAGRITRLSQHGYDLSNVFFCDMLMTPSYPFDILDAAQQKWLQAQLAQLQPVVVFIDTLREAHGSDENDSTAMRNVITQLVASCRPAAIVLVSHSRKDTAFTSAGGDDLMNDARGSSYVPGRMDTIIKVTNTGILYKGRSVGQGRIDIRQDPDSLLLMLDGEAEKYFELLHERVREMRTENPKVSIKAMADDIEKRTSFRKHRVITDHIGNFLQNPTLAPRLARKPKSD